MARKSNKTAHVLNLIAGHDAGKDNTDTANSSDAGSSSAETGQPAAAQRTQTAPPASAASQNVAVIDTTEDDPVADLIQQKLTNEFEQQPASAAEPKEAPQPVSTVEPEPAPNPEQTPIAESIPESAPVPEPEPMLSAEADSMPEIISTEEDISAPSASPAAEAVSTPAASPITEPAPAAEEISAPEPAPEPIAKPEPTPEPVPEPEPEPDFVRLNVMEEIVKDKIIYFMRQFDVCTCDRCVNDTIALTMNGLLPKYIVTTPAAVDPLLSYYTNRLISDVTVEATKACMVVKDNPRH